MKKKLEAFGTNVTGTLIENILTLEIGGYGTCYILTFED